jgi:PAS domain S-box-containing protein
MSASENASLKAVGLEDLHHLWEKLQAEVEHLAGERDRYLEFFAYAPEAYLVTDRQGKIEEANLAAVELFGLARSRLTGKALVSFVPLEERRAFRQSLNALNAQGRNAALRLRVRVRRHRGKALPVEINVRSIDRAPASAGYCWLLRTTE